jgi:hypothetical protein
MQTQVTMHWVLRSPSYVGQSTHTDFEGTCFYFWWMVSSKFDRRDSDQWVGGETNKA